LRVLEVIDFEPIELSILADCSVVFSGALIAAGEFWNEMIRMIGQSFVNGKVSVPITLLSRIIPVVPDHIIAQSYAGFRNMTYSGLNSESLSIWFEAARSF
jgi:hypothetical protein